MLIGARSNTQFILPQDWPYPPLRMTESAIRKTSAHDERVQRLLADTIGVADAATALGMAEAAVIRALRNGALGGARVRDIWRTTRRAVDVAIGKVQGEKEVGGG